MKKIILSLLFAGVCVAATAQVQKKRYTINPDHILYGKAEFGGKTTFDIYQTNNSQDTITVKWGLVSNNLVKGWDYSPCAYGTCYVSFPDSLCTMNPILPNEEGFLAITLDPHDIKGTGSAKLYLYDVNAPSLIDTITFVLTADAANGIHDYTSANALKVYPNPATESITVKMDKPGIYNASIQIIDVLGKPVYSSAVNANDLNVIDVKSLSRGIYFVRYNYGNGTCATKKLQIIN